MVVALNRGGDGLVVVVVVVVVVGLGGVVDAVGFGVFRGFGDLVDAVESPVLAVGGLGTAGINRHNVRNTVS